MPCFYSMNNNYIISSIKLTYLYLLYINSPLRIQGDYYDNENSKFCYIILSRVDGEFILFYYDNIESGYWYKTKNLIDLNNFELECLFSISEMIYDKL